MIEKHSGLKALVLPGFIHSIDRKLTKKGFECYVVGGAVRDFLLGKKAQDFDLLTNADLAEILDTFPEAKKVGASFGIVKIGPVDLAMMRKEGDYKDGRHPEMIEKGNLEEDLSRRNFTMNSLVFRISDSSYFSYKGGLEDLNNALLKTIGKAKKRFEEDRLRILRALRFSFQIPAKIDPDTEEAMLNTPDPFKGVSSERIRVELEKCFKYQNASLIHEKLKQYGLLRGVFESEKPRFDLNLDVHELDLAEYCFFMCFVKKSWPIPFTKEEWAYLCWLEYCQSFSFKNDESIKKVVLNRNFFAFIKKLQAKNWGSHEFLKMKDKLLELNLDQKNAAWLIKENFLDEKDPSQIPKNKLKLVKKTFN